MLEKVALFFILLAVKLRGWFQEQGSTFIYPIAFGGISAFTKLIFSIF